MNKEKKIEYIYNIINNKNNNNNVFYFIQINDIKYNKNSNGIFINLSILNEEFIDKLYDYIKYDLNTEFDDRRNLLMNYTEITTTVDIKKKKKKKIEILNKNKEDISDIDTLIIDLSKTI